jgi:hypothetical protein
MTKKLKKPDKFEERPRVCFLTDPMLIVAPHDPGSPPSWVPHFHGEMIVWVDRPIFDKLVKLRDLRPCDICPSDVQLKCHKIDDENKEFEADLRRAATRIKTVTEDDSCPHPAERVRIRLKA